MPLRPALHSPSHTGPAAQAAPLAQGSASRQGSLPGDQKVQQGMEIGIADTGWWQERPSLCLPKGFPTTKGSGCAWERTRAGPKSPSRPGQSPRSVALVDHTSGREKEGGVRPTKGGRQATNFPWGCQEAKRGWEHSWLAWASRTRDPIQEALGVWGGAEAGPL